MKKRSSKIIFASLGALTSISAISVGLVSCGKNTTTPTDKAIPSSTLTPEIRVPGSNLTPGTEIFNSKTLMAPLTSAIKAMPKYNKNNFRITDIVVNDTKVKYSPMVSLRINNIIIEAQARVYAILTTEQGQQKIETTVFYHVDTKNYKFGDINITELAPFNPKQNDVVDNTTNPFDDSYKINTWSHNTRDYNNKKLFGAIYGVVQQNFTNTPELSDFEVAADTLHVDMKTHTANVHIHGHASFEAGTPFDLIDTYNYQTETHTVSDFTHQASYKTELSNAKIKTEVINEVYSALKGDAKTITNINFSTPESLYPHHTNISDKVLDNPSTLVSGTYDIAGETKKFSTTIAYAYDTDKYSFTGFDGNTLLSHYFLLGKTDPSQGTATFINPGLHGIIDRSVKADDSDNDVKGDLVWTSGLIFANKDYNSNIVSMKLNSSLINFSHLSPRPFSETISYNLKTNTYSSSDLVVLPSYKEVLSKDKITKTVKSSLQKIKDATTTNVYLTDFDLDRRGPKWGPNNTTSIKITGTARMNGFIIKSFSETITYDYTTGTYAMSNFKETNSFNPLDNANATSAIKSYLEKTNPKLKITDVNITYLGNPAIYTIDDSTNVWLSFTYINKGGLLSTKSAGKLDYSFTTKTYTFKADKA